MCGTNEAGFCQSIRTKLALGETVAICCRTKRKANIYARMFGDISKNIYVMSSDASDEEVRRALTDINACLADVQLFLFTSKVNIGVDVTIEWNNCYVDGTSRGCGARDMLQMIGRFRNLTNDNVNVLLGSLDVSYASHEELFIKAHEYHTHRREVIGTHYRAFLTYDTQFKDGYLTLSPTWISELFSYCNADTYADFNYLLFSIARMKQWRVFVTHENEVTDQDMLQAEKDEKENAGKVKEEIFNEVVQQTASSIITECEPLVSKQQSTIEDRMKLECAHVLKYFPNPITYAEYTLAVTRMPQLRNYTKTTKLSTAQSLRMEVNTLHKHAWSDHTLSADIMQYKLVDDCLQLLGVSGIEDTTTEFTIDQLNACGTAIRAHCDNCAWAGKRRGTRNDKKTPTVVSVLRRELRDVYGLKIRGRRVGRKGKISIFRVDRTLDFDNILQKVDFGYNFGEQLPPLVDNIDELHSKKRKTY